MHTLFRLLVVFVGSLALVFYSSCERHAADELPHHGHGAGHGDPHSGEHAHNADKHGDHGKAHHTDQHEATTAMSVTPPPRQSPTPANFFPTATPH